MKMLSPRISNRHLGLGTGGQPGSVYEEYRYDALGRRVLRPVS
jgi:hypothetical protein